MNADDISLGVIEILNAHQIPYMLVGSLSTNFHSVVRSTKDADIVVQPSIGDAARLIAREFPLLRLDSQSASRASRGRRNWFFMLERAKDSRLKFSA